jgi:hypothetical protein
MEKKLDWYDEDYFVSSNKYKIISLKHMKIGKNISDKWQLSIYFLKTKSHSFKLKSVTIINMRLWIYK